MFSGESKGNIGKKKVKEFEKVLTKLDSVHNRATIVD